MWKRGLIVAAALACMAVNGHLLYAQSATVDLALQAARKKNPKELVDRLKNANLGELQKLTFLELNLLKNAVYASKGYRFANDRPWLNELFCGGDRRSRKKKAAKAQELAELTPPEQTESSGPAPGAAGLSWKLGSYDFPVCKEVGPLDEDQKKAIANTRVAIMKKLEAFNNMPEVDKALNAEVAGFAHQKGPVAILGKQVSFLSFLDFGYVSLRRDLHGMNRMLQVMKNTEDFDQMELLGLFMGDIIFLRNAIEAKEGKSFPGVQGWEISQLIGVSEQKANYDPKKIPEAVRKKIDILENIATKIQRSELNDIPESFKNRPIAFDEPYDGGGC